MPESLAVSSDRAIHDTRGWLERAVIGLNLCPFAKAVHAKGQIHYAVSSARTENELLNDFAGELDALAETNAVQRETTLLIAPDCLADFIEFSFFLEKAKRVIRKRRLEAEFQLASFHPAYMFADAPADDIGNFTNRSPYPTLHLLREASVDRAVRAFPQADTIFDTNIRTLRALGPEGWARLQSGSP